MNNLFNQFGGFANFMTQFNQFRANAQQNGINPQQRVQELLNSGQMTQEQFNNLRNIANIITGRGNNNGMG